MFPDSRTDNGPVLSLDQVGASYGQAKALFKVTFDVHPGEVVALLGVNGSGKSTTARTITGLVRSNAGRVNFLGEDITRLSPHKIRRRGLVYLPEERGIARQLTVVDNLRIAAHKVLATRSARKDAVENALETFPEIARRRRQPAHLLSGGEQQMLALARAFIGPVVLLVADEVSLGLGPLVVDKVYERLDAARTSGVSVLLIEQFVNRALGLADRCVVLRRGSVAWSGTAELAHSEVMSKYLD